MTLPPPNDDPRPVVLQEPARELAPVWQPSANKGFVLRPEEDSVANLHLGWAQVLAPEETPLWQGKPVAGPRLGSGALPLFLFGFVGLVMLLNMGLDQGVLPFLLIAAFLLIRQKLRSAKGQGAANRLYLLTNRAAYLARAEGNALFDIQAYPITPSMRLGVGPRAVAFATRRNAKGKEEAEGFLDIEDAATVHAMIREVQQGRDMGRDMGRDDQWGGDGAR